MTFFAKSSSRSLRIIIVLLFVAAGTWLVLSHPRAWAALRRVELQDIALLLTVTFATLSMTSTASWHLLNALGSGIRWRENLALTLLANFLNYFGPVQPGMGAKALYLKRKRATSFLRFATATATNAIIMLAVSAASAALIYLGLGWTGHRWLPGIGLLAGALAVVFLVIVVITRIDAEPRLLGQRFVAHLRSARHGFKHLLGFNSITATALGIVVAQYALSALAIYMSYSLVAEPITPVAAFLIAVCLNVANFVVITPGNLGVAEIVFAAVAQLSGHDFTTGLLAAAVLRAFHLLASVLSIPFFSWHLARS